MRHGSVVRRTTNEQKDSKSLFAFIQYLIISDDGCYLNRYLSRSNASIMKSSFSNDKKVKGLRLRTNFSFGENQKSTRTFSWRCLLSSIIFTKLYHFRAVVLKNIMSILLQIIYFGFSVVAL